MTANHEPILVREVPGTGAIQNLYRFPNGYGASLIRGGTMAYGGLEMAVVRYKSEDATDFHLVYDTPVTDDVLGYPSDDDIDPLLAQIKALPNPSQVSA